MAKILDGRASAAKVREDTIKLVNAAKARGIEPTLAVILVGEDPASQVYVRLKTEDAAACGINAIDVRLPEETSQEVLESVVRKYNDDPAVHGVLVQLPIPAHLDAERIISLITPEKDVDGFSNDNLGRLVRNINGLRSCTPAGIMRVLADNQISVAGKDVVIIGRSNIVGKPLALLMPTADATDTLCPRLTQALAEQCRAADVLLAAVGRADFVTADMVKEGAVVVDVGINRTPAGMRGDVVFEEVEPLASAITPVPGGIGPMTRCMLMLNTALTSLAQA